jgi:3-oxoacyl-[acyl-carrier protein] reductase
VRRASEQNRIVVTGAAGEIGRSTVARLAQQKFDLVLVARRITPALEDTAAACRAFGVQVDIILGDLAETKDRARLCEALGKRDDVAALVHVASPPVAAPVDTHVKVNFEALVEMTHALLPGFLRRQKGRVIAIGSSSVEVGISGWEPYAGAKAMLSQYLHTFDRKHRLYGITAQVIAPTRVDTAMSRATGAGQGTMLIPEEVAACIAESVTDPQGDTTYLSLSPSGVRGAYYGVYTTQAPPTGEASRQPAPQGASSSQSPSSTDESALVKLERTVRAALALPASVPLDNGGLGLTPGWDSLKHIEIMLAVERDYGIEFSSSEIDRLSTYAGLRTVVEAKSRKAQR